MGIGTIFVHGNRLNISLRDRPNRIRVKLPQTTASITRPRWANLNRLSNQVALPLNRSLSQKVAVDRSGERLKPLS